MRQRRKTPASPDGQCISTMTAAPDCETCSISICRAQRTNANETSGENPATIPRPVRLPRKAIWPKPALNTPTAPQMRATRQVTLPPLYCHATSVPQTQNCRRTCTISVQLRVKARGRIGNRVPVWSQPHARLDRMGPSKSYRRGPRKNGAIYCSGGSPLVRFLARSISVTAIRISVRVLRSGASSIACFSAGP